ncbi:putative type IX secretion system sortase PorU2 [Flammeovirga pacifica]|uniref:Gingipain domain-containing protein n=1 Tax=Flammeovirga pacifica TaxID=915059 RepID=A0A1S1Z0U0_FLAPC|nr:C25 family cysteine peptidase [Flammeovirga pacifica]OHX66880.1 hypothetical protein NH26_11195 [Flammeovirga pacifica]
MRQAIVYILLSTLFLSTPVLSQNQDLDNWREKTRNTTFFRMEVRERGLYRITKEILEAAGYPVSDQNANVIRMYRRGVEIAINVSSSNNRIEYIEFYGDRNDGGTDVDLFVNSNDHVNPFEPVYSRTAVYFLSTSDVSSETAPPKRIQTSTYTNPAASIPTNHYYTETYRGVPLNGNDINAPFGSLRTSYCRGHSTDTFSDSRNKFRSNFADPRGWTSYNNNSVSGVMTFQLSTVDLADNFNDAKVEMNIINFAARSANVNITSNNGEGSTSNKVSNQGINSYEDSGLITFNLSSSEFSSSDFTQIELEDTREGSNNTDRNQLGVSYINLTYPQKHADIDGNHDRVFQLPSSQDHKLSVDENNEGRFYDITNQYEPILLPSTRSGGKTEATLEQNSTMLEKKVLYSVIRARPSNISRAEFEFTNNNLTYNYLIVSHEDLNSGATSYANYRRSTDGGSNNVYLAEMTRLYNTFSWGEQTPLAIRNCIKLLHDNNLQYILLLGKGLDLNYDPYEKTATGERAYHYVPAYGFPGSDVAYTMYLEDENDVVQPYPQVPIGRMSAINNQQILDYLNKVIEHDAIAFDDLWRKRALHLSGGATPSQQVSFKEIVDRYKDVFIDTLEGGTVETISRETDGSIEFIDVSDIVNDGISLMTFFGHSSSTSADIDIGEASDPTKGYQNQGKYPFIVMNGCGGGNFLTHEKSWGEDWVETPNKGGIGFMAKSGIGSSNELEEYGNQFYNNFYKINIGDNVGLHINQIQKTLINNSQSRSRFAHVEQFDLQGDPFIKISPKKVDFALKEEKTTFTAVNGSNINANDNIFYIDLDIFNFGRTSNSNKIYIEVKRRYSNGTFSSITTIDSLNAPYNFTSKRLIIENSATDKELGGGDNLFTIIVGDFINSNGDVSMKDPNSEGNLNNNTISKSVNFSENRVAFIQPLNLSVVHDDNLTMYAYDYSYDKSPKEFHLQLSTDTAFTSVTEERITTSQLVEWNVPLNSSNDTTVYYARVRFNFENEYSEWSNISFTKINNSTGNGKMLSNFYQMEHNVVTSGINLTEGSNNKPRWDFPNQDVNISVGTGGKTYGDGYYYQVQINNNIIVENGSCSIGGDNEPGDKVLFLFFDQNSGEIVSGDQFYWNDRMCGQGNPPASVQMRSRDLRGYVCTGCGEELTKNGPYALFEDPGTRFLKDGDYVLTIFSGSFDIQTVPTDPAVKESFHQHYEGLAKAGLDTLALKNLPPGTPFIGWSKYNDPTYNAQYYYGGSTSDILSENFVISPDVVQGSATTNLIGPTSLFNRLWVDADLESTDLLTTQIFGQTFNIDGSIDSTLLYQHEGEIGNSGLDLAFISELKNYSFMGLKLILTDPINKTAAQLNHWRISYSEPPNCVFLYDDITDNTKVRELQQGQKTTYNFTVRNVSNKPFIDTLLTTVNYNFNNTIVTDTIFLPALPPNANYSLAISPQTWEHKLQGNVDMNININADRAQMETFFSDNTGAGKMNVMVDETTPAIDILFDGQRIIDGDIVAPNAMVSISLNDENEFLNLDDFIDDDEVSLLQAFIKNDSSETYEEITLANLEVTKVNNQNHIIASFNLNDEVPQTFLDENGNLLNNQYTLRVTGSDVSGNKIGDGSENSANRIPYLEQRFNINQTPAITNFYPYPNPFSDNVRFVFQITGIDVPDEIKIQIMTVTGRVVKEIFQDELGPIRIGTNISEYAWDGRDEFGDQLANGVYLYRVIIPRKKTGEFDHIDTGKDHMFKHNIGKLYLLR